MAPRDRSCNPSHSPACSPPGSPAGNSPRGQANPRCQQPHPWQPLPSGAPGTAQPWPPPPPELPPLFPRLCHSRSWDHLPISVACSLKLIICQCELGWGCAGLAGDQNLPFFQSHPARPPRSGNSPAAAPEGWGIRCCLLEGKKKCPTN